MKILFYDKQALLDFILVCTCLLIKATNNSQVEILKSPWFLCELAPTWITYLRKIIKVVFSKELYTQV